jgi:hypothetical protein
LEKKASCSKNNSLKHEYYNNDFNALDVEDIG